MYFSASVIVSTLAVLIVSVYGTPMDDYAWKEDPNYSWFDTGKRIHGHNVGRTVSYVGHVLNMTSQRWLTDEDTTRSLWWHFLVVIVPSNYNPATARNATLWITDGRNDHPEETPDRFNYNMIVASELAMGTGLITGSLFQIPNEPMIFPSDPIQKSRSEDAIIAFTWAHFLDNAEDAEWLVRLPMVKASLRAMDTMTAYAAEKLNIKNMDYYSVTGASKRGWTTWDVAAVDYKSGRVACIAPIVLDAINFVEVEHHQWRSYGGWSFLLKDYWEQNITRRYDEANMTKLQEIVDPYWYRDRLTMPKLIVNAGGDEFQQPDDTHYWWNDMPEPKYFLMMPNTEHSTATGFAQELPAIGTFIKYTIAQTALPSATWTISPDTGDIVATLHYPSESQQLTNTEFTTPKLANATMWYAKTCNKGAAKTRRDFRFMSLDDPCECGFAKDGTCYNLQAFKWSKIPLEAQEDGTYVAHMDSDPDGRWTAFFIDFTFEVMEKKTSGLGGWPYDTPGALDFTTEVSVWPDTFPFEDCVGEECYGELL